MSDDGLQFEPLCWTYHDGWKWKESKRVLDGADANGNPTYKDRSKEFHHRGHCHLFFAENDIGPHSSQQAYWGKQKYEFHITDEWGPNSEDPNQIENIRLIGSPIWYFYIEEYWRRMYIQPWDRVDKTCKLPCNQAVIYDKMTMTEFLYGIVASQGNIDTPSGTPIDIDDLAEYESAMGFNDYWYALRRQTARKLWVLARDLDGLDEKSSDGEIVRYIQEKSLENDFNSFFLNETGTYDGYVSETDALRQYVEYDVDSKEKKRKFKIPDHKTDAEGNVFVPQNKTEGHVGIRWDASKPCHSLGPFRETGGLYFFNTVVNRTMPCEYWLDESKRTRQYFIKKKERGVETSGGGTWTFADDKSRWIWVQDVFAEAQKIGNGYASSRRIPSSSTDKSVCVIKTDKDGEYINEWEDQYVVGGNDKWTNHRIRNLRNVERGYSYQGQNAKRLKDDHDNWYVGEPEIGPGGMGIAEWRGTNERVLQNPYDESEYAETVREWESQTHVTGYYNDDGYQELEIKGTPTWVESENALHWFVGKWQGWYEKDELVKCAFDGNWYIRTWGPPQYDPLRLGEDDNAEQPYWTRRKRMNFPNPPPWLCDGNGENPITPPNLGLTGEESWKSWAETPDVYADDESNRMHLMHWEYAHYYDLVHHYVGQESSFTSSSLRRRYVYSVAQDGADSPDGESRIVKRVFVRGNEETDEERLFLESLNGQEYQLEVIALDWETASYDWNEEYGRYPQTIEEENACFENWIAQVGPEFISCYEDTIEIDEERQEERLNVFYPKEYVINPESYRFTPTEPLVSISFSEFRGIWRRLTNTEIKRLNLIGDMPSRKISDEDPSKFLPFELGEQETDSEGRWEKGVYPTKKENGTPLFEDGEIISFRNNAYANLESGRFNEAMPSMLMSEFFPRIDEATRRHNEEAAKSTPPGKSYPLSPQDEGDELDRISGGVVARPGDESAVRFIDVIDPFRNGKVNPIENWKKYFDKMEEYTIPETTVAKGDHMITNTGPNSPNIHPRESSYSVEDGARRHYPDDKFVTPIIEYQKVIHLDYERLPGHESERFILNNDDPKIGRSWTNDVGGAWGDGFDVSVTIPFEIGGEIQSPFSDASRKVSPPNGEEGYFHNVVKPENMMRYHVERYNSIDQVRKYDFPNYVDLIHEFQAQFVSAEEIEQAKTKAMQGESEDYSADEMDGYEPEESFIADAWKLSPYQEDFNNYESISDTRAKKYKHVSGSVVEEYTWEQWLQLFWEEKNEQFEFDEKPVVRGKDCYGNAIEYNTFVRLKTTGKYIWRENLAPFLPTEDKVAHYVDDGKEKIGYLDSENRLQTNTCGAVVRWNNPLTENTDGIWVEQCLGAIVKPKCCLILEDGLGHRWKQWVEDTALQSNDPLRGKDYDLGEEYESKIPVVPVESDESDTEETH